MECPWKGASNWAWGRGQSKVGPMSQPHSTINIASRDFAELILLKAAKGFDLLSWDCEDSSR